MPCATRRRKAGLGCPCGHTAAPKTMMTSHTGNGDPAPVALPEAPRALGSPGQRDHIPLTVAAKTDANRLWLDLTRQAFVFALHFWRDRRHHVFNVKKKGLHGNMRRLDIFSQGVEIRRHTDGRISATISSAWATARLAPGLSRAKFRQRHRLCHLLKHHSHRHANGHLLRVTLHDIRHHTHAFLEFNERRNKR